MWYLIEEIRIPHYEDADTFNNWFTIEEKTIDKSKTMNDDLTLRLKNLKIRNENKYIVYYITWKKH